MLDAGITAFDTAESYANGLTERILGKGLGADRSRVAIFSKVAAAHLDYDGVIASCEATLERIGTDYLDLYQIHWPSKTIPLEETIGALEKLKADGKIREIGVSNFGPVDLDGVVRSGKVVSNQMGYNLLFRGIEYDVLPKCRENGIGVLTYSSLAQGLLSGKYKTPDEFPVGRARTKLFSSDRPGARHGGTGCEEIAFQAIDRIREISHEIGAEMSNVALAWILAQPGISAVIADGRTAAQALVNARAVDLALSPDVVAELSRVTEEVKAYLGAGTDAWSFDRIK
jgi:aryl-alcohol dehydrogenase-like predicted oxidoreductase